MRQAVEKANQIISKFGYDLDKITESLGLFVIYEELEGRLKEIFFGDAIVINSQLPKEEQRELVAHAIGHRLMHAGNHITLQKRGYSFGNYHEKQANIFAACLLMPRAEFEKFLRQHVGVHEAAERFQVTEELVRLRVKIWKALESAGPRGLPTKLPASTLERAAE